MRINSQKKNIFFIISISIGGAIYGYSIGIISGVITIMQKFMLSNIFEWSIFVAAFLYGVGLVLLIAGYLVNIIGCRKQFLIGSWFSVIAVGITFFTQNIIVLIFSRFILGVACGLMNVSIPMYIAETLPSALRGRGTSSFQLFLAFGIFFSSLISLFLSKYNSWYLMFIFQLIICIITVIVAHLTIENPLFLLKHGKYEESLDILKKTRSQEQAQKDFDELIRREVLDKHQYKTTTAKKNNTKNAVILVVIAMLLCFMNQSTCINAILQYREQIMNNMNIGLPISLSAAIIAFINFIATAATMFVIDRIERRTILQIGLYGLLICSIILLIIFKFHVFQKLGLIVMLIFVIFYALGPGTVVWTIISEIIPHNVRGIGIALALSTGAITAAVITTLYLPVMHKFGLYWMFIFSSVMIIIFILISSLLPNTTQKSLAEIELSYK